MRRSRWILASLVTATLWHLCILFPTFNQTTGFGYDPGFGLIVPWHYVKLVYTTAGISAAAAAIALGSLTLGGSAILFATGLVGTGVALKVKSVVALLCLAKFIGKLKKMKGHQV